MSTIKPAPRIAPQIVLQHGAFSYVATCQPGSGCSSLIDSVSGQSAMGARFPLGAAHEIVYEADAAYSAM